MKMSPVTEEMKGKAEVCHGDERCKEKFMLLLAEIGFPAGLLALQHIEECGYVKEVGFVWLRLHKEKEEEKKEHRFENVVLRFDTVVTAYFEPRKIKKLTGVKAKEFLIWISLCEIYVGNDSSSSTSSNGYITFKTSAAGISKSFPISMFRNRDREEEEEDEVMIMKKMKQGMKISNL
ncbi:hypothetical protein EZV62_000027 [Acer yangbiense]|uniref:DUF538 domain-containing protein n=1 Tax=Acer yangbiense TaxID=1000413 RepID=A0A5C7IQS5_9ROSI|nr:hypothetical protein EZV62_000027 [Acer yangbiense]